MEAKGCAKPAVWKNARRHFYWAVRARVARSAALAEISNASPGASYEYRSRLLNSLASIDATTEPREVADKLENLDLTRTMAQLKADHLIRGLIELSQDDRKAAMDGLTRLADTLTEDERTSIIGILQNTPRSAGTFRSSLQKNYVLIYSCSSSFIHKCVVLSRVELESPSPYTPVPIVIPSPLLLHCSRYCIFSRLMILT